MKPAEIKAILLKMNDDFWHKQDLDETYKIYADGFVFHRPPFPSVEGKQANRASDAGMLGAFSEIHSTCEEIIVEGDVAAIRWSWQAVHTGTSPSLGIPPSGKQVQFSGCSVYHFQDDKLVEQWEFGDYLGLLQQMGVIPAMG
ncbi:MAG: ester cyclase [Anaerolineales bacterium]|jgi:predicted ester cyclase